MPKITQKTYINVRTREEYNELMKELEKQGFRWVSGKNPNDFDGFQFEEETVIHCEFEKIEWFPEKALLYACKDFYTSIYTDTIIIPYDEWVRGE